jgi:hypothetical protein
MSHDAVALLRIPGYTPPEDADVRELDDGFLLFLGVPFEAGPDAFMDAIEDALGEASATHQDPRGIFVFPDAAEPEDATTYDQVVDGVADGGGFIAFEDADEDEGDAEEGEAPGSPDAMLGQLFEALGAGSADDLMKAIQTGDQDALKLAQIRMMGAVERAVAPPPAAEIEADADDPAKKTPPR